MPATANAVPVAGESTKFTAASMPVEHSLNCSARNAAWAAASADEQAVS